MKKIFAKFAGTKLREILFTQLARYCGERKKYRYNKLLSLLFVVIALSACGAPEQEMSHSNSNYCAMDSNRNAQVDCFSTKCALGLTEDTVDTSKSAISSLTNGATGIFSYVLTQMRSSVLDGAKSIHNILSDENNIGALIKSCIVLSIMLFGVSVVFGMVDTTPFTTIIFIIKVIVIYSIATDWALLEFSLINWVEAAVDGFSGKMFAIMSNQDVSAEDGLTMVVNALDTSAIRFLSAEYWKLQFALFFTGWNGWLYVLLSMWMIYRYIFTMLSGLKVIVVSLIIRAFFYGLAPIFFTFKLFKLTEDLFDAWVEQIVNFSLQPIFTFVFLGIFSILIADVMNNDIFIVNPDPQSGGDYAVCWKEWQQFGNYVQLHIWQFDQLARKNLGPSEHWDAQLPVSLWGIISAIILIEMMRYMINWSTELATKLSGGIVSSKQITAHDTGDGLTAAKSVLGVAGGFLFGGKDKRGIRKTGLVKGAAKTLVGRGSGSVWKDAFSVAGNAGKVPYRKHLDNQQKQAAKSERKRNSRWTG